jgi:phosphohistidine phosphatase
VLGDPCRAAYQVGEIAARYETGQYITQHMSFLLLVHHGDAVGPEVDAMRPLSTDGRAATNRLAIAAADRGAKPDVIWHSGKLRARQTAEFFWKACNPFAPLTAERGLLPDDPPQWMGDRVTGDARSILIVGHMPYLPRLLALLLEGHVATHRSFPPHGCVALEPDGDRWKEVWRLDGAGE